MILLVLLLIILTILVIRLFVVKEGFYNEVKGKSGIIPSDVEQNYQKFLDFYNPFSTNWQKAITTSLATEIQQQPLTSPSQSAALADSNQTIPTPSEAEFNEYVSKLSQQLNQPLPPMPKSLPQELDSTNLKEIITALPSDSKPFVNALNWMNTNLDKSHGNLNVALQGGKIEGFQDQDEGQCPDISNCILNNPAVLNQIAEAQENLAKKKNKESLQQQLDELQIKLNKFTTNQQLYQAVNTNQDLVKKSEEIQRQAQSGELINQVNVPGGNTVTKYEKPPGANALADMKKSDPQKYNDYKQNYSQWFAVKSLIEQINNNL